MGDAIDPRDRDPSESDAAAPLDTPGVSLPELPNAVDPEHARRRVCEAYADAVKLTRIKLRQGVADAKDIAALAAVGDKWLRTLGVGEPEGQVERAPVEIRVLTLPAPAPATETKP